MLYEVITAALRAISALVARDRGFLERRHAGVARHRGAQQMHREHRAGALAEAHPHVQDRVLGELAGEDGVADLGRGVGDLAVVERAGLEGFEERRRGGAGESYNFGSCMLSEVITHLVDCARGNGVTQALQHLFSNFNQRLLVVYQQDA